MKVPASGDAEIKGEVKGEGGDSNDATPKAPASDDTGAERRISSAVGSGSAEGKANDPNLVSGGILHEAETMMVQWIRKRVALKSLTESHWTDEHETIITEFLFHPNLRRLVAFIGGTGLLELHTTDLRSVLGQTAGANLSQVGPNSASDKDGSSVGLKSATSSNWAGPSDFTYFILRSNAEVTPETMSQCVQYGRVQGRVIESLLRVMNGVYVPRVLATTTWPESVKKDFAAQMHKFMASLTENANAAKGKTVLYLPQEDVENADHAALDKDLVQVR